MLIVWLCGCVDGHGMNKQQFDKFSKNESLYNILILTCFFCFLSQIMFSSQLKATIYEDIWTWTGQNQCPEAGRVSKQLSFEIIVLGKKLV